MGKLFNLNEWHTVADAAQYLSDVFKEKVREADVLQYALKGHLRLSVNFVNHAPARCGKVVQYTEAKLAAAIKSGDLPSDLKWMRLPKDLPGAMQGGPRGEEVPYLMSLHIGPDRYLTLSDDVITLQGVWDLPMIGSEQLDIEHAYHNLTGGPAVTLSCLDGAFVERRDGQIYQLQEDLDDNEHKAGSTAALVKLKQHIAKNKIKGGEADKLLQQHKEARKKFLEERKTSPASESYYPADGLPKDRVIVVCTEALREFEQTINGIPPTPDKPITPNERNSLLTIIAALCEYSDIKHQERGAASQIAKLTEEIGAAVSDDTVRRALAKIPDALGTRMK